MIAAAAPGGGTKITVASGWTAFMASSTVLKTGKSRCMVPPLPALTPPTIFVPYSMACLEWKVPCFPVKPWQMTLLSAVSNMFGRVCVQQLLTPFLLPVAMFLERALMEAAILLCCWQVATALDSHSALSWDQKKENVT